MIQANNLVKIYKTNGGTKRAVNGISFKLDKGERIALLGSNGSGKSTLIRMLGGVELPTEGSIIRDMSVSWPIGFSGGFQGALSGLDNVRFLSRIYAVPFDEVRDYVEDFSGLGNYLKMPLKTYSSGMIARLAFGLSLAIDFDCYLIDEILAVGDHRFHQKCIDRLFGRNSSKAFILATHIAELAREYCSKALVLTHGRGKCIDDLDTALEIYRSL